MSTPVGPEVIADRMGIESGHLILERGYRNDCDESVRREIVKASTHEFINSHANEVVDAVIIWWREEDGDLVDELVDGLTYLVDGGPIWLFTPKMGRPGYVEPSEFQDAAPTAGLSVTSSFQVASDWSAIRLVSRKAGKMKTSTSSKRR